MLNMCIAIKRVSPSITAVNRSKNTFSILLMCGGYCCSSTGSNTIENGPFADTFLDLLTITIENIRFLKFYAALENVITHVITVFLGVCGYFIVPFRVISIVLRKR